MTLLDLDFSIKHFMWVKTLCVYKTLKELKLRDVVYLFKIAPHLPSPPPCTQIPGNVLYPYYIFSHITEILEILEYSRNMAGFLILFWRLSQ